MTKTDGIAFLSQGQATTEWGGGEEVIIFGINVLHSLCCYILSILPYLIYKKWFINAKLLLCLDKCFLFRNIIFLLNSYLSFHKYNDFTMIISIFLS